MPQKPKTPCKHPGCPALVDVGKNYCDKHKPLHPERPSPAKRGYNSRWRKVRAAYLRKHPLCVKCLAQGRYAQATVVNHIVPHRGDREQLPSPLQALSRQEDRLGRHASGLSLLNCE